MIVEVARATKRFIWRLVERKAEVDGLDKEGTLLVPLPSSHSLLLLGSLEGGKIKKCTFTAQKIYIHPLDSLDFNSDQPIGVQCGAYPKH